MALKKLTYIEFEGEPREWRLDPLDFGQANLVVGRNATGKTRLVNLITSLMWLLAGNRQTDSISTGHYIAEFDIGGVDYVYEIALINRTVELEVLKVEGVVKMQRGKNGKGEIYYAKEDKCFDFEIDPDAIAFQTRRDRLQHPYILNLSDWASTSATYAFGSEFGKNMLMAGLGLDSEQMLADSSKSFKDDPNNPLMTYVQAFNRFGNDFDKAVVSDMRSLGFPVTAVHAEFLDPSILTPSPKSPLLVLSVSEEGIAQSVTQMSLSQGMYRALALVIKLNWMIFSGRNGLLLIDDLGEGLDYERACSTVGLAFRKAKDSGCQVIVTSNDRFVMNAVPLENWVALKREGAVVKGYTSRNSPKAFEEFRFTGLSNFDFFTSEAFH